MSLTQTVVAISGLAATEPQGSGFLIDNRMVATCAHVVNAALGRAQDEAKRPTKSEKVAIRFCALPEHGSKIIKAHLAEVDGAWDPPPAQRRSGADFCLLELEDERPPFTTAATLGQSEHLIGRSFQAVGFPKDWDFDTSFGFIVGDFQGCFLLRPDPHKTPSLLLRPRQILGPQPRPAGVIYYGFSGGPVEVDGAVVGMLVEARQLIPEATAYMMPVSAFPQRFSKRAKRISPDEAIATRPAEPGSPNSVLVTNYLEGISAEADATAIFLGRRISEATSASEGASDPATKPSEELLTMAAERVGKLVLLGEPGLGKSTALKHLETEIAVSTLEGRDATSGFQIPILIELKNYRGEPELESLLAARVNEVLRRKKSFLSADGDQSVRIMKVWLTDPAFQFFILLDAMDEMPAEYHQHARSALRTLLNHPYRFVVSCRTADYDRSLYGLAGTFSLVPLKREEIADYLMRALGEKGKELFNKELAPNPKLFSLASNALFLSMIVEIGRRDVRLPRNRGLLFRSFVDAMIRRRRQSGSRPSISPDIVLNATAVLAFQMLDRGVATPPLSDVRGWTVPRGGESLENVLSEARKYRFLRSDGSGVDPLEFIHPLWREYFVAEYLSGLLNSRDPDFEGVLGNRVGDRKWREAIISLVGLLNHPMNFIRWFAARLENEARSGSLFSRKHPAFWIFSFLTLASTQVGLLMQCWEGSAASGETEARKVIIDLLRIVIQHGGPALVTDPMSGSSECDQALRAVQRLKAVELIPELDKFSSFEVKRPTGNVSSAILRMQLFGRPPPFARAREIARELRTQKVEAKTYPGEH